MLPDKPPQRGAWRWHLARHGVHTPVQLQLDELEVLGRRVDEDLLAVERLPVEFGNEVPFAKLRTDSPDLAFLARSCDSPLCGHHFDIDAGRRAPLGARELLVGVADRVHRHDRELRETVAGHDAGTAKLVGTDKKNIVAEAVRLLDDEDAYATMSRAHNPYGDGKASQRIVEELSRDL